MSKTKKYIKLAVCIGSLFFLCVGCNNAKGKILASVEEHKLYMQDVELLLNPNLSSTDSISQTKQIVNTWIETKTKENFLKTNSPASISQAKNQLLAYKDALYTMYIENKIIEERLDTIVSEKEILSYFKTHRTKYAKEKFVVKAAYLKIPLETKEKEQIKRAMLLKNDKDEAIVKNFANLYAINFYFEPKKWIFFDDLVKEMPISIDKNKIITSRISYTISDEKYSYFLKIFDYKLKRTDAPLTTEKEKIKRAIIAQRVKALRKNMTAEIKNRLENKYEIKNYLE